jgi:hypothetical protein
MELSADRGASPPCPGVVRGRLHTTAVTASKFTGADHLPVMERWSRAGDSSRETLTVVSSPEVRRNYKRWGRQV